jgi:hypothetical protein
MPAAPLTHCRIIEIGFSSNHVNDGCGKILPPFLALF